MKVKLLKLTLGSLIVTQIFLMPAYAYKSYTPRDLEKIDNYISDLSTDRSFQNRGRAAIELGVYGHPKALEALHKSLNHDVSSQVRIAAANAIARINSKDSIPKLILSLKMNNIRSRRDVQLAIIRGFGEMGANSKGIVHRIMRLLKSKNAFVREATVEALWKISKETNDYSVGIYLIRLLKIEKDLSTKLMITSIISDFENPKAFAVLQAMIDNPEEKDRLKELAHEQIKKLEEKGFDPPPKPKKDDDD